jgi:biopolymer transport protein TolR
MAFAAGVGKGRPRSDINITPLVDVVLVLLIIFMVMTPILLKQFDVQVPEKADVQVAAPAAADQLVLQIAADGAIALNHEPVQIELLGERVRTALEARREKLVFFDVDEKANFGLTVEVMDTCRGAGAKVLGIMTK